MTTVVVSMVTRHIAVCLIANCAPGLHPGGAMYTEWNNGVNGREISCRDIHLFSRFHVTQRPLDVCTERRAIKVMNCVKTSATNLKCENYSVNEDAQGGHKKE